MDEHEVSSLETHNSPSDYDYQSLPLEQDTTFPTGTIYRHTSIFVGSFLGGPLVAGYIIAKNFAAFDEFKKVWVTWIITLIATLIIFVVAISLADTNTRWIPAAYTVIAYVLIRQHQGAKIDAHIKAGGATHGWLHVIGISIVGLLITLIAVVVIAVAVTGPDTTETHNFLQIVAPRVDHPRNFV